jgi:ribosomal-protein-alanine N-acetyltransferase
MVANNSENTLHLKTERLDIIPCSLQVARAIVTDKSKVETILSARVSDSWPAPDLLEFLPFYAQQLETDLSLLGWGVWLMIHVTERVVIGDVGFKGKPDHEATVEIGYSVIPAFRNRGYALEAAQALINWAFIQQGVKKIIAECNDDNAASIRILEKLGMKRLGTEGSVLKWELKGTYEPLET